MATMRRALIAAVLALCLASDAGASRVVDGSGSDATRADPSVGSLGGDDRHPASESSSEAAALGAYVGTQGFVDKPPEPKGLPRAVFIHIPKTGGTTIELSAARRGVRLGMCAARCESVNNRCETFDPEQLYETQPGYGKCSRVHRPPRFSNGVVPDSFCVVRNPFDRLISEFHYNRAMPWNAKSKFEDTCEDFQTWLTQVTDVVINSKMVQCHLRAIEPGSTIDPDRDCPVAAPKGTPWEDCHTLPQSLYVAGCETVLANERWEEDVMPFMHKVAGVEPSEMEKATLYKYKFNGGEHARDGGRGALGGGGRREKQDGVFHGVDDRCWVQLKWETIQRVHEAYEADFRQFGYSAMPQSFAGPSRGYTKAHHVRKRAARLGYSLGGEGSKAGEIDRDGISRCLKPLKHTFLNALFQNGFIAPEVLMEITAAEFAGRI